MHSVCRHIHAYMSVCFFTESTCMCILISGCAICQNYMFSGESNISPFFRRLKQI